MVEKERKEEEKKKKEEETKKIQVWKLYVYGLCMEISLCLSCVRKILLKLSVVGWYKKSFMVYFELVLVWKEISDENGQNWSISVSTQHPYA